ncbi:MAG TPA: site-specific integrase [Mycobacteriales bacterium]|nr:site-specific integrase [Mycobacteriales bacterium]
MSALPGLHPVARAILGVVVQLPSGRWQARIKQGRTFVESRTFDLKREAVDWHNRRKATLSATRDVRRAREPVAVAIAPWLSARQDRVQRSTYLVDRHMTTRLPTWFAKLAVSAVTRAHVEKLRDDSAVRGVSGKALDRASVERLLGSLSAFVSSLVKADVIPSNPVRGVTLPRTGPPKERLRPLSDDELADVVGNIAARSRVLAPIVYVLARTGLRWSEARALVVGDALLENDPPLLLVQRAHVEGDSVKSTKSYRPRRMPLTPEVVKILGGFAYDKQPSDLLLTTPHHAGRSCTAPGSCARRTGQPTPEGGHRTISDTPTPSEWLLTNGVPIHTVKAYLGHSSITTTEIYLQYVGDEADRHALALLTRPRGTDGGTGGTASEF